MSIPSSRKPVSNIAPFGLRLQPDLKRRLEDAAKVSGRSLNTEITRRLESTFDVALDHENMPSAKGIKFVQAAKDSALPVLDSRVRELERLVWALQARVAALDGKDRSEAPGGAGQEGGL